VTSLATGPRTSAVPPTADSGTPAARRDVHAARVRSAGLRATTPRVLVTSALAELAHPTAEQIHQHLRGTGVNVSTVYRTLTALEQVGLVARFHPDDGIARYHPDDGASQGHLHLLCRGCLQVLDVPAASVHQAVQAAVAEAGYRADPQQLTVSGRCRACREQP